ncbi:MAG: HEAT repeat domain-containing protein [Planctomycetota bacterium]|nr:HEAT repeat domain-containing protein [Planctomycetota bacterium]
MTKTKESKAAAEAIPLDVPTLSRWLQLQPQQHVKRVQALVTKASEAEWARLQEGLRVALQWAWDEQPDVFFPLLRPWLKNTSERLRALAAGALPLSHETWRDASIKELKRLVTDKSRAVRVVAADLLVEDPASQVEQVRKLAASDDPEVRAVVARHLQAAEGETLKKLLPALEALCLDPRPEVHWAAAATLCDLHERDARAVLEIARKMALSPDEDIRAAVAASFFENVLADVFDQLLPTIRGWLKAPEANLRWTLVRSLRFLRVTPRSLQLLKALYEDKDPEIRRRVAAILVDLFDMRSEHGRALGELLRRAKGDQSKRVREIAEEGEERHGVDFDKLPRPGEHLTDLPEDMEGELDGEEGELPEETPDDGDDDDF